MTVKVNKNIEHDYCGASKPSSTTNYVLTRLKRKGIVNNEGYRVIFNILILNKTGDDDDIIRYVTSVWAQFLRY